MPVPPGIGRGNGGLEGLTYEVAGARHWRRELEGGRWRTLCRLAAVSDVGKRPATGRRAAALLALVPKVDHIATTMTGELADCFTTKAQGVKYILNALSTAADGRHTRVYLTNGKLVSLQTALRQPLLAAASNWHALANFASRYVPDGVGLLIDVGTTTCDLIPLVDGSPVTIGKTDPNRMINGELIYTGVQRSPVCRLPNWCRGGAGSVPWRTRCSPRCGTST